MIRLTEWEIIEELETKATDIYSEHEIVAQAQLRKDYMWGEEDCLAHSNFKLLGVGLRKRRQCPVCRQVMKEEAGL